MKKLLSKVQKSRVVNYTRMHQSSYVSEWSWAQRARVVLGEFWDVTLDSSSLLGHSLLGDLGIIAAADGDVGLRFAVIAATDDNRIFCSGTQALNRTASDLCDNFAGKNTCRSIEINHSIIIHLLFFHKAAVGRGCNTIYHRQLGRAESLYDCTELVKCCCAWQLRLLNSLCSFNSGESDFIILEGIAQCTLLRLLEDSNALCPGSLQTCLTRHQDECWPTSHNQALFTQYA